MNQWPNAPTNGMFPQGTPGHLNPASMYSNLAAANQLDFSQFTQTLQNGSSASSTPGFPSQNFQPGSVVPAKRSHDGMSASPVQNQGSRSQTPSYGGAFSNQQAGGQQFANAPTPYSHLQQSNSNNASPSPTMQNQPFRPPGQQQRMQNASPSSYPQQQQQQQQQQQANFGNQMSPGLSQNPNLPTSMPPQNQMAAFNQQYGMNANPSMSGMSSAMSGQMNNMQAMNAQKAYQMKLMQHQQQLRNSGMMPRMPGGQQNQMLNAQQQMVNGQTGGQMNMSPQQQQSQKRAQFLRSLQGHAQQAGRQFNPTPLINGKPVDLFALFHLTTQSGGSANVDRSGQWQTIANRMGFLQQQYPSAAQELRQLFATNIAQYERLYIAMQAQQQQAAKQEKARKQAHEMAGLGGPPQGSPTRTMQTPNQQAQYQQFQQGEQNQIQPESTPVQANAQLPQNGMVTPQQQSLQHRRASSVRKPEQMTPQTGGQSLATHSPNSVEKVAQRSPSVKQEPAVVKMKFEESRSTEYEPAKREIKWFGGYDVENLSEIVDSYDGYIPYAPTVDEMGVINIKAISLSLASGIHSEVRYALDALAVTTNDKRISFDLQKCEDLLDIIIDCGEDQIELLSEEAAEVSDALDLAPYEDVTRASRLEAQNLQDVPEYGTQAYELDRAAEKLIAIATILRNLSFWEPNHAALTSSSLIKWFSNTIRLLGTRNLLLRTYFNTQDFYKDMIIFLSNITGKLALPSRDDALHILHFLLAFAPQPAPCYSEAGSRIRFTNYNPWIHRYLPPAVDSLAKLLARQDPNRMLYKSIFTASSSSLAISESPLDLLTRAFALSISVLPDRAKGVHNNNLRIVEARKAYMSQGMLAADILTSLAPGNDTELARAWIESEDGWVVGLLNLAAFLSVDRSQQPLPPQQKPRELGFDHESFRLIAQRALAMLKRLIEKAGKGSGGAGGGGGTHRLPNGVVNGTVNGEGEGLDEGDEALNWEGVPQSHNILGALMLRNADKVALGLLCNLHEMTMSS